MKALDFKEANTNFGATQDEYNTLPGWQGLGGLAVFCFEPSDAEADLMLSGVSLQILRLTFGEQAQRTGITFTKPDFDTLLPNYLTEGLSGFALSEGNDPEPFTQFSFQLKPHSTPGFIKNRKIWVISELTRSLQPINIFV